MADELIKSVHQTPAIRDALKKRDGEKKQKPKAVKKPHKKDSKRIIDTYA